MTKRNWESMQQDMFNNSSSSSNQLSIPHTDPFPEKVVISSEINRDSLSTAAQQIIDDLNAKRKQDTQLLIDLKKALEKQTEKVYKATEQHLFAVYDKQGKIVQDKIQQLFSIIDNISKLETELKEFKQALQILYQDMKD
ncbi:hypothetical protein LOTGIDRAFT_158004 [Lottia gigantea]|uniref:Synaptonemal complex central element protein 2 n=1 Tax=Lottia gigantea TaxID=225164 RepID=V4AZX6_LOTGI|nr:hypothetical protein LOTGIDRAFT_158004 [Lottia gigantea]ESP00711.1 hypothetical protein LOTGIDRAFT_158004 [Lottia gigantea]